MKPRSIIKVGVIMMILAFVSLGFTPLIIPPYLRGITASEEEKKEYRTLQTQKTILLWATAIFGITGFGITFSGFVKIVIDEKKNGA